MVILRNQIKRNTVVTHFTPTAKENKVIGDSNYLLQGL